MRRTLSLLAMLVASPLSAEGRDWRLETVLPTIPGKNNVRWWEFDWKWTEFTPAEGGAPVRLYFYESEREVARVAKPSIEAAYAEYVERFDFLPRQRVPFLLYNSHFEFESTRAFFVSEQVLGVTSVEDLTMALPYWGEHQRYRHVMRHELAHQFTIQKVVEAGRGRACNPVGLLPLWFVEGIAELFSQDDLGPEARAVLADRQLRVRRGERRLPDFFSPGDFSFERVYLVGHAQARFLEETYGEGTVRRILDESPRLCGGLFVQFEPQPLFEELVSSVLRAPVEEIDAAWKGWARAQVADAFEARQPLPSIELIEDTGGEIDSLAVSPDGTTLFYRTVDRDTAMGRLFLMDLTRPGHRLLVTQDQRIGLNSLHPFDRRVVAIGDDRIAYVGRVGATDVVFVQRYRRDGGLELGARFAHRLSDHQDLIEAGDPAIHPLTGEVFFVGLSRASGFLDVFRLEDPLGPSGVVTRVTEDAYAERGLAFDRAGALYFASDATADGHFELFRLDRAGPRALTLFPTDADVGTLSAAGVGDVVFAATAEGGRRQAFRYSEGAVAQLTDVPTSFESPAIAYDGRLLGLVLSDERRRLASFSTEQQLWEPVEAIASPELAEGAGGAGSLEPWSIPRASLEPAVDYSPLSLGNYRLVSANAIGALGPVLLGHAVFADRFRTHVFGVTAEVLGSFERTNAALFFLDQSRRLAVGGGVFISTGLQLEGDPRQGELGLFLLQRYGITAQAQWPFGPYTRVEAFVSPQAIRAFDFTDPLSPLAARHRGTSPALQLGVGFALDTLRVAPFGPVDGVALSLALEGTGVWGGAEPFGQAAVDLHGYKTIVRGYERLFLHGRVALGTSLGGAFREEFYLPAAYNLRALPEGTLALLGEHYYLGQAELQFPLLPELGGVYLQGLVGVDAGAIFFDLRSPLSQRQAAAIVGANLALGPLALRLHLARPFDIGGGVSVRGWIPHLTLSTPFFLR